MILHLFSLSTLVVDLMAWLVFHVYVSASLYIHKLDFFNPESWLYLQRFWESDGKLYQALLKSKPGNDSCLTGLLSQRMDSEKTSLVSLMPHIYRGLFGKLEGENSPKGSLSYSGCSFSSGTTGGLQ